MTDIYGFAAPVAGGGAVSLDRYRGAVLLVVNTASKCGFTPQYTALEALQQEFAPRGFSVLAFPCNQFGGQEPGDDAQIAQFCATSYATSFPVFAKVDVNGDGALPLFAWLRRARPGLLGSTAIKWNFTKFLVGRDGLPIARHAPATRPEALHGEIVRALDATVGG